MTPILWVFALLPLVLFCWGFAYLLVLLDRGGGKNINFGTSKARELSERNSPTVPPTVIVNDDEEELAWVTPPIPVLDQKQVDDLKNNIQTQEDALAVSINETFLSGQPVCGNMGNDGKWTFEKLDTGEKK